MPREVTDEGGTRWVCAQAYAGLKQEGESAPQAGGGDGPVEVVCTPSGGEQTVRLELESGWEDNYSDEELLREIGARR